jgi:hypothetical protein
MKISRRHFAKGAALATASLTAGQFPGPVQLARGAENRTTSSLPPQKDSLPTGKIGGVEFSRLILGCNLITGSSHARDLQYVAALMKHYNTEAKILETLELAETHGINAINMPVWQDTSFLEKHWKRGGKMKWLAMARPENGDLAQFRKAVDGGASAVHLFGGTSDKLVAAGQIEEFAKITAFIKSQKVPAGVAAHALSAIQACERAKIDADFYIKTLHTHDYRSAPPPGDTSVLGSYDNSWCADPDEVIEFMWTVKKPWIAFKVMAAGAIPPRTAFNYAFEKGADFILAGIFDWQVEEDVKLAKEAIANARRTRAWLG